ncbi:hypothetical protein PSMK_30000 [Phycisphaera mikurensis NBRC 102666]|uniref:Uncharacterized protein n=1 Tax=Phycisphaera mikurensis (strain NBRC 102666 / KCTC 22515 / FYK2301M01) TaxID=1142394 RepID=I0IIS1_PHYMF|nr:hypothetical protein PSMK_30000 [Phycisphaera mikurensis NBRC 102666]
MGGLGHGSGAERPGEGKAIRGAIGPARSSLGRADAAGGGPGRTGVAAPPRSRQPGPTAHRPRRPSPPRRCHAPFVPSFLLRLRHAAGAFFTSTP